MNDISIIVNSCDDYEDVWALFFCAFQEFWPDCKYQIVINTESKQLRLDGFDLRTHNFSFPDGKDMWGLRLKQTLSACDSKYVIMIYDDFILEGHVNQEKILKCAEWLDANNDIAAFYFTHNSANTNMDDNRFDGFELIPKTGNYTLNSAPAIWRRDRLIGYVNDKDTPWAWEFFGSYRTYHGNDLFYCVKKEDEIIYPYNYSMGGAIYRGKWVPDVVLDKIERYCLDIDFSVRGFVNSKDLPKRPLLWKIKFFYLGFEMIGVGVFFLLYRALKAKYRGNK